MKNQRTNASPPAPALSVCERNEVKKSEVKHTIDIDKTVSELILSNYTPASVLINEAFSIIQYRGQINPFLDLPHNTDKINVIHASRDSIRQTLSHAIEGASETGDVIRSSGISINVSGNMLPVEIEVIPVNAEREKYFLILFKRSFNTASVEPDYENKISRRIEELEKELAEARTELSRISSERNEMSRQLQTANDQLKIVSSEAHSSNEELKTVIEELSHSQTELKATSKELQDYNQTLRLRNKEIADAHEYIEAILDTMGSAFVLLDSELKIKTANSFFYNMFGGNKEETVDRFIFEINDRAWENPLLLTKLKDILPNNSVFQNFQTDLKIEKETRFLLLNGRSVALNTESSSLILLTIQDITRMKRNEIELIQSKCKAEKAFRKANGAMKAKQEFLTNMSHEIRTPLNAIIGFTEIMVKSDLSAQQREYLTAIKTSGDTLLMLINDILDLAKIESGKVVFEQIQIKLCQSINDLLKIFDVKLREKNIQIVKEFDSDIPGNLMGDPLRLHQIILNLFSNAVKFTPQNGKITLTINVIYQDEEKAIIKFSVADTGIGIAEDKLKLIFENFQHASTDTARNYGGTGLGLAITKKLIQAKKGMIFVKSKVNEGSVFSFILPFKKKPVEVVHETNLIPEETSAPLKIESGKKVKVLVVEDMRLNQFLMETLLTDFGVEYDIASNGQIAIDFLKENTYDLIFMDLQMQVMNGFEATEHIRNVMKLEIPVIALTADVTTSDIKKCKTVGMNDYISKPINEKLLYNKILKYIQH